MFSHYLKPFVKVSNDTDYEVFEKHFKKLYLLPSFKPMGDVLLSQAQKENVTFVIEEKHWSHKEEGYCKTLETSFMSNIKNTLFKRHKHQIVLRKNTPSVIAHEMGHALEKESGLALEQEFVARCQEDIAQKSKGNPLLHTTIRRIMLEELKSYAQHKRISELFARYFEMLASGREFQSDQFFSYKDVESFFKNTHAWMQDMLLPSVSFLIDANIAKETSLLIAQKSSFSWTEKTHTSQDKTTRASRWAQKRSSQFDSSGFDYTEIQEKIKKENQ